MINLELQRRIEEAKRRANGSWMSILERLGVDHKVLGKHNQPCPGCGGKDRFQFTDKYADGNYICRGCGPGDGFALLELCLGWKFTDALKAVAFTAADAQTRQAYLAGSESDPRRVPRRSRIRKNKAGRESNQIRTQVRCSRRLMQQRRIT
jgi:putative DNA primase/helicase